MADSECDNGTSHLDREYYPTTQDIHNILSSKSIPSNNAHRDQEAIVRKVSAWRDSFQDK